MVADKIQTFFGNYKKQSYKKGELLKNFDEKPSGIFCLEKGNVRCYAISKEGLEATLNTFKPIAIFPMNWIINNTLDNYIYEATTDVEASIAPRERVETFLEENPDVVFDLLKRIYRGLEGYFLRMESLLSGDAYLKTIVQIIIHTKRFGTPEKIGYAVDLTQTQVASLAGLTRETVTREIRKLEEKNLVSYRGKHLLVLDLTKLEQELDI
jgi:CRP-like cAMP-binding protein